jgi:hypothetical protein
MICGMGVGLRMVYQARQTKGMTAFGDSWTNKVIKTNGTGGFILFS